MPKIQLMRPLGEVWFAGAEQLEIDAANLFTLVAALDARAPGFAAEAELHYAFAVDGRVVADWATPLTPASEVLILPRISGG